MSTDPTTYGPQNLKALRTAAGLSRREFIDRLKESTGIELHQTSLQRLESGEQTMKASDAVAFATYFDKTLDEFLCTPADPIEVEVSAAAKTLLDARGKAMLAAQRFLAEYERAQTMAESGNIPPAKLSAAVRELEDALTSSRRAYRAVPAIPWVSGPIRPELRARFEGRADDQG